MKLSLNALLLSLFLCIDLSAQTKPSNDPCAANKSLFGSIRKPDTGWDVSMIDRNHKLDDGIPLGSWAKIPGYEHVIETTYGLRERYFDYCDHFLYLETVWGMSLDGKTFAIGMYGTCGEFIKGERMPDMCKTYITLVDTTGNGKFDLLEFGRSLPTSIPEWVKKPQTH